MTHSRAISITVPTAAEVSPRAAPIAFLPHVHRLRGVAMMLVVGAHCWPEFAWTRTTHDELMLAFDNVTVVFMVISGLLFQHLSSRFTYRRYLAHRFKTVLLPYLLVSLPAVLFVVFVRHRDDVWPWVYQMPPAAQIGFFLATGKHLAPLWFMPMIALFILAAPMFVAIDRRNLYPVVLPLTIAVALFAGRDSVVGLAGVLGKALFMAPAYLAGMAFARHRAAAEAWCQRRFGLLLVAFAALSALMLSGALPRFEWSLLQKLTLALLLLAAMRAVTLPPALDRALDRVAAWSFAIYFVHGYVITACRLGWTSLHLPQPAQAEAGVIFPATLLGLGADIVLVLLASLAIVALVKRLAGPRSRYLIGA